MKHRCAHCTEVYRIGESTSLYPQSFCSKGCEVESVVMDRSERSFKAVLQSLGFQEEIYSEVH
jgi:hypothetical protein